MIDTVSYIIGWGIVFAAGYIIYKLINDSNEDS